MTHRYSRQVAFAPIGEAGQQRISGATVVVVGCGALGSSSAEMLARAGVGTLSLIDRDLVELSNIQRQSLFTEEHARQGIPKAVAARKTLEQINSEIEIKAHVVELSSQNVDSRLGAPDLILDATDNFAARYLMNDYAVKNSLPWIFASCLGSRGTVATFLPGSGYCLRCILGPRPPAGTMETCLTAGVLAPAARLASALQVSQALKLLIGKKPANRFYSFDLWRDFYTQAPISAQKSDPCSTCQQHVYEFLSNRAQPVLQELCGEESVQIWPSRGAFDYAAVRSRLHGHGPVHETDYMLRLSVESCEITLFKDGRSIIRGAASAERAKSIYANYIGY